MGTYAVSGDELIDAFKKFLKEQSCEGDISAQTIADAWNHIAKRMKWTDRLIAFDKQDIQ